MHGPGKWQTETAPTKQRLQHIFPFEKFQKPLTSQFDCCEYCPLGGMAEQA